MREFEFVVRLRGSGSTEDEAWADAVEAFGMDPGEPESAEELKPYVAERQSPTKKE